VEPTPIGGVSYENRVASLINTLRSASLMPRCGWLCLTSPTGRRNDQIPVLSTVSPAICGSICARIDLHQTGFALKRL
jgi:hypothetical protein